MSKKIIQLNNDLFSCKRINIENFQDEGEVDTGDTYTDEDGNVFTYDYNIEDWVLKSDAAAATEGDAAATGGDAAATGGDAAAGGDAGAAVNEDMYTDEDGNVFIFDYNINDWVLQSEPASAAAAGGDAAVGGDAARTTRAVTLDATGNMVAPGPKPKRKPKRKSKKRSKKSSKPRAKVSSKKVSKKASKPTRGKAPSKGSSKKSSKKAGKGKREGFCAGNTCLTEDNLKSLIKLLKKLELKK